jgi:hypothetical protein
MKKSSNSNLTKAKKAKNDEFYTQYEDIQKEVFAYLDYDENVFRDKTILLPCDDPEWSNFTKFFAQNFEKLGIKKLVSTSYAQQSKSYQSDYHPTLFETESPLYDKNKTTIQGKIFTLTREDLTGDGKINIEDIKWNYLDGDGDFRSDEVKILRDEADVIITNPPFSLFREFLAWIVEADKKFLIIGSLNAVKYVKVFPLIKSNILWLGTTGGAKTYIKPDKTEQKMGNTCWFTNIDHGRRHQPLKLMSAEEIIKFSTKKEFLKYDNYDAIDVARVKDIPSDYKGYIGVPITFLEKYCPEQFEIVGLGQGDLYRKLTPKGLNQKFVDNYYKNGGTGSIKEDHPILGYYNESGIATIPYMRIVIRHKS